VGYLLEALLNGVIFVKNAQLHDKKWNLERENSVECIYSLLVGKEMHTLP
jgi:hypothetical protein